MSSQGAKKVSFTSCRQAVASMYLPKRHFILPQKRFDEQDFVHIYYTKSKIHQDEEAEEARTKAATGTRSVGRKRKATANLSSGRPKKARNSQAQDTPTGDNVI